MFGRFRFYRIPPLLLAGLLQAMPLLRITDGTMIATSSGSAMIFRWGLAAAMLGAYDSVSGASTVITSAGTATGKVGVAFSYRITTGPDSANVFNAVPLPPGLSVNPPGKNGFIMGTPTQAGTWNVLLTASDNNRVDRTVTKTLVVTIASSDTAPTIVTQPQGQTVVVGSPLVLTVTASGTSPIAYQWKKDGLNLSGATNATFSVAKVAAPNAGGYSVVVTNSAGSITSSVATVTVVLQPTITAAPIDETITIGGQAAFSVSATGSTPLAYQWQFNGANITGATNVTLTLSNVQTNSAGSYAVRVSNAAGTVTSPAAHLTVTLPLPLTLFNLSLQGNEFRFRVQGSVGDSFILWASADLETWTPVLTNKISPIEFEFVDPNVSSDRTDFYRATLAR